MAAKKKVELKKEIEVTEDIKVTEKIEVQSGDKKIEIVKSKIIKH